MVKLTDIVENLEYSLYPESTELSSLSVSDIAYNSANAGMGILFVCLIGARADGHDFAAEAYRRGSRIFVCQKKLSLPADAVQLITENTRRALAVLSAAFFGHPERKLSMIGVTGTKGKSTVCEMIYHILTKNGIRAGSVGTIGVKYGSEQYPTGNTTPESYELFRIFSEMAAHGVEAAVIEVSSQGIKFDRVFGISFFAAVMTNLSEDHIGLGEHPDFEDYKRCKMELFRRCRYGIFNADDPYFDEFSSACTGFVRTYSVTEDADWSADNIVPYRTAKEFGVTFTVRHEGKQIEGTLPLPGMFSVSNALAAMSAAALLGVPPESSVPALMDVSLRGRFEIVQTPLENVTFLIDFAHNGDSLARALVSLRAYRPARLICLFGSVGGRTQVRRRELGLAAAEYADFTILTSDNPDKESPYDIIRDIEKNMPGASYIAIPDRKEAIEYAVKNAAYGDIVLIAGKGHEAYQLIDGKKIPFSERDIIQNAAALVRRSVEINI